MRYLIFFFISLLALSLQTTFFARFCFWGIVPDLILILVVSFAFLKGSKAGMMAGFIGGLLEDIFLAHSLGIQALSKMLIAYLIGLTEKKVFKENPMISVVGITFATMMDHLLTFFLYQSFDLNRIDFMVAQRLFWPELVYNALLAPMIYILLYKWLIQSKN